MAKKIKERKHEGKFRKYTGSPYGSHKAFVKEYYDDGTCLCDDGTHTYTTYIDRLDNGLADPRRLSAMNSDPQEASE